MSKSGDFKFPEATSFKGKCFRNIYTIHPSQDLYDDILDDEDYEAAFELENHGVFAEKSQRGCDRVFDYGEGIEAGLGTKSVSDEILRPFLPPWGQGRFGDGLDYGVFYAAKEKETSIIEALYHQVKFLTKELMAESEKDWVKTDRKLFEVDLEGNNIRDLMRFEEKYPKLVDPDDNSFCQKVGRMAKTQSIDALLTPSVRRQGGCCIPVFEREAIKSDRLVKYLEFKVSKSKEIIVNGENIQKEDIDYLKRAIGFATRTD